MDIRHRRVASSGIGTPYDNAASQRAAQLKRSAWWRRMGIIARKRLK